MLRCGADEMQPERPHGKYSQRTEHLTFSRLPIVYPISPARSHLPAKIVPTFLILVRGTSEPKGQVSKKMTRKAFSKHRTWWETSQGNSLKS